MKIQTIFSSSVFDRMLDLDMTESQTGEVEIPDVQMYKYMKEAFKR